MNRSGYSDDWDGSQEEQWALIRWRGAVNSAIRGKRGQALLRELVDALDAMEDKRLIPSKLGVDGPHCALGVVCEARGLDISALEFTDDHQDEWGADWDIIEEEFDRLAGALNVAPALVREVMFINDETRSHVQTVPDDEHRWSYMRAWCEAKLKKEDP